MNQRVREVKRPFRRLIAIALAVTSAIALAGCGSDTSTKPGGSDAQRSALGVKGTKVCVTGRTGSPMTVYLSEIEWSDDDSWALLTENDPKQTGPFSLAENSCFTNDSSPVHASVYNADGTRAFSLVASNPLGVEPQVIAFCTSSPTRTRYGFSEGLQRALTCGEFEINIERMTDSETEKHFQVYIALL